MKAQTTLTNKYVSIKRTRRDRAKTRTHPKGNLTLTAYHYPPAKENTPQPQPQPEPEPPKPTLKAGDRIIIKYLNQPATITGNKQFTLEGTLYMVKDDEGSLFWEHATRIEPTTTQERPYPTKWYGHNGKRCYWTLKWDTETNDLISIDPQTGEPDSIARNEVKKKLEEGTLKTPPSWYKEPESDEPPKNSNVWWILANSTSDINFKCNLPRLTDEELDYCLSKETRKTGIRMLKAEKKKRGNRKHEVRNPI